MTAVHDRPTLADGRTRARDALRAGRPVLLVDDLAPAAHGVVVLAAETLTVGWTAWAVRVTSGVLCAAMTARRAADLRIRPMVGADDPRSRAFGVAVDAADGITTGISAQDRTRTLRLLADPAARPDSFVRPGHVLPLLSQPAGPAGCTEVATDLCLLADLAPVALLADLVSDDGAQLSASDVAALGLQLDLPVLAVSEARRRPA